MRKRRSRAKPLAGDIIPAIQEKDLELLADLEPDDAAFVKAYLMNGSNQVAAAQAVWPHLTYGSASVASTRVMAKVRGIIHVYMDRKGLTIDRLLNVVLEGLDATQPVVVNRKKYANGKLTEQFEEVTYSDDFKTRQKYTEMALKLRDLFAKPPDVTIVNPVINNNNGNNNLVIDRSMLTNFEKYVMEQTASQMLENVNTSNTSQEPIA